jgi:hypothetical protein
MCNFGSAKFFSAFVALLVSAGSTVGCVSNEEPDDKATAGTPSGGNATAGSNNGGGNTSTAGSSTGGGGSGGSGGMMTMPAACATVATASGTSPLITDFESLTTATGTYTFESGATLGGSYIYTDNESDPAEDPSTSVLELAAGHDETSTQALVGKIHNATWGGGMGLWFGCIDATVYTGVTFWARGASPAGPVKVNLSVNAAEVESKGGGCPEAGPCVRPSVEIELTDEWEQHTFAWADFSPGDAAGTPVPGSGEELYGIDFSLPNDNTSRDLELAVDDFSFTKE